MSNLSGLIEYPTEAEARSAVVAEALSWLGTPWHHHACVKGVGVDCAHLPAGTYWNTGLAERFAIPDYPRDWHIHKDVERFVPILRRFCGEITRDQLKPGDIMVVKIGRVFSHGAIVVDWPVMIHAHIGAGCVTLADAERDSDLADVPQRYFSFWAHHGR